MERVVLFALPVKEKQRAITAKLKGSSGLACECFHLYLYGLPKFDVEVDHEALKVTYSRKPSATIAHQVFYLRP